MFFNVKAKRGKIKFATFVVTLLVAPLLILSLNNPSSFKNSFASDFTITSDIGIINYINDLRGQPTGKIDILINRISENKYLYITKYLIFKGLTNLTPATFFTTQVKLLGFSFVPPVLGAFLIPFLFGSTSFIKKKGSWKYVSFALCLILPSLVSKPWVDLNRLIIFFPVLIYLITLGLGVLIKRKQKAILAIVVFLLFFQYLVLIFDLELRAGFSSYPFLGSVSFSLGKQ